MFIKGKDSDVKLKLEFKKLYEGEIVCRRNP